MEPVTIAKMVFEINFNSVLRNLEILKWSLGNTRDVIGSNEELLEELENLLDEEKNYEDFEEKLNELITLVSQQQFILLMSYYEYYLYFLKALIDSYNIDESYPVLLKKYLFEQISLRELYTQIGFDNDLETFNKEIKEIRNALMHRNSSTKKDKINYLTGLIDNNLKVKLNHKSANELIKKISAHVDKIDLIVIKKFPNLNLLKDIN